MFCVLLLLNEGQKWTYLFVIFSLWNIFEDKYVPDIVPTKNLSETLGSNDSNKI